MVTSKVIRIDQEVWAELQRRAIPFKDNPNSVLRRLLGLTPMGLRETNDSGANSDPRIARLLQLVEARIGQTPVSRSTLTRQSHKFNSLRGKVVAFIYTQKRRLKVESGERVATQSGINAWDHWLRYGWWGQDNSVYWHIPNDDDGAYDRVAGVLDKLWRH